MSQANVDRLAFSQKVSCYCLAMAQIYAGPDVVKITSGTAEFIDHWPVREPGKSRIICITILGMGVLLLLLE